MADLIVAEMQRYKESYGTAEIWLPVPLGEFAALVDE